MGDFHYENACCLVLGLLTIKEEFVRILFGHVGIFPPSTDSPIRVKIS